MEEKDPVQEAVKRIEYNLKELAGMTHSPDAVRQLNEDIAVLKAAVFAKGKVK